MAVKRVNQNTRNVEDELMDQIGNMGGMPDTHDDDVNIDNIPTEEEAIARREAMVEAQPRSNSPKVGEKLTKFGGGKEELRKESNVLSERKHLSNLGDSIAVNNDIREGWLEVDRALLGERDKYYPKEWVFRIRPATVEAIRNWSTIDEESPNSVDTVFDEMLKSCLSIRTPNGPLPWNQIYTWDRLFFVLLCREYSFVNGERKVEFQNTCPNCGVDITFKLDSQSLMYDMPDDDLFEMFDPANRCWHIYPADYDVQWKDEEITLYMPTREKDNAIKEYIFNRVQQDRNAKLDRVFFKFLPWMLPKISKDSNIASSQIRKAEIEFKSWDIDMFSFMDEVLTNISITPSQNMLAICPSCGEEATAPIQFPDGVASLFTMAHRHKKFGKK